MSHKFKMYVSGDKQDIIDRIKDAAQSNGINFSGDTSKGRFSGKVTGSYSVSGNNVSVTLTKVPLGLFTMVEGRLRDELED